MIAKRPILRLFLDESVPDSVGQVFMAEGHDVGFLNKTSARSAADPVVCVIADINDAILVALDGDMKRIAQGHGVGARNYLKLGLIKLSCYEPDAARRVKEAMSLIEHEWNYSAGKSGRRIFIEILDTVIRTVR